MGNAFNVQRFYNGTRGGASGDSYITLPQTVTEYAAVAHHLHQSGVRERERVDA